MKIGGVTVHPLTYQKALRFISGAVRRRRKTYICVSAAHLIVECQDNEELRNGVNRAGLVTPDGMPLVWLLRVRGHKTDRVYGPDLLQRICKRRTFRIFIFGGRLGQSRHVADILARQYPGLQICGNLDTPRKHIPENSNAVINASRADIVVCGLGCPHQELWMIRNRSALMAPVLIGVGAAFDFLAGHERQAHPLIRAIGFEWLFRFIQHPIRLFLRYTVTNFRFLGIAFRGTQWYN